MKTKTLDTPYNFIDALEFLNNDPDVIGIRPNSNSIYCEKFGK